MKAILYTVTVINLLLAINNGLESIYGLNLFLIVFIYVLILFVKTSIGQSVLKELDRCYQSEQKYKRMKRYK